MAKIPDRLRRTQRLYHFTDKRNIPSIWNLAGLWSTARLYEKGAKFHPGGNQISLDADKRFGMDKHVHLCFTTQHPMAYTAVNTHRTVQTLQWIYVEDAAAVFEIPGVQYCEEVANKSGAQTHSIEYAREHFDEVGCYDFLAFEVDGNQERKQAAEKCEILVPDHLPLRYFQRLLP